MYRHAQLASLAAVLLGCAVAHAQPAAEPPEHVVLERPSIGLVLSLFLVLSPTVHPWYGLWLAPFLATLPRMIRPAAFTLVAVLPLSYVTPWWQSRSGIVEEPGWNRLLIWVPVLIVLGWELARRVLRGRS